MIVILPPPARMWFHWSSRLRRRFRRLSTAEIKKGDAMGAQCSICGKKPVRGNSKVERGKAKYLGGNGRKTTGITKRWVRPNLQSLRMQTGETSTKVRVCAKCIRGGLVVKRVVRKPFTVDKAPVA